VHQKRTKKELADCHALRQVWYRSGPYWDTMHRAKIAPNQYKCEGCGKIFKLREVQVDHNEPVVDVKEGWINLQEFAKRLFCPSKYLKVLCQDLCHKEKSEGENKERRRYAKSR